METLIGFAVGYVFGTRQGREGLANARRSWEAIRTSPEVRQMLAGGVAIAGSAFRQVLRGGAGAVLSGAVDAVTHRMSDTENRQAA
jgi:hypothetical protein